MEKDRGEPLATRYLGKQVQIKIDRPLGSHHPTHGFIYSLNYGLTITEAQALGSILNIL